MSDSKLSIHRAEDILAWDDLCRRSQQGTLFSESLYLAATGRKYHRWLIKQNDEIKAGVCLPVSIDEQKCELDELVIYAGILFGLNPKRQLVKRRHDEFQISEFVAEWLSKNYNSIALSLSPQFQDMRPFLWYRYHDDNAYKYKLDLRYTSYLSTADLQNWVGNEDNSPFFSNMETVRRYSIREAKRKGGSVVHAENGQTLITFYRLLMEKQSTQQSEEKLSAMSNVIQTLLHAGRGAVFHALDENGTVLYAVMYGWDSKRAYYLFGAGNPKMATPWQGTLIHWEAFKFLAQHCSITEIDMEGVNSPQRGWFKLGFGGDLRSYFHILKGELS